MHNNTSPPNHPAPSDTPPKVLAGIDGSASSNDVVDYAAWIAQRVNVPLQLLHSLENHDARVEDYNLSGNIGLGSREHLLEELTQLEAQRSSYLREQGKKFLSAANERAIKAGIDNAIISQRSGSLVETLVETEDEIRVLVLGISGSESDQKAQEEGGKQRLGIQLETILRSLHKPILVVNRPFTPPQSIMLAYDGGTAANKALDMLVTSPLYKGLTCHIVHVANDLQKAESLLEQPANQLENAGVNVIKVGLKSASVEQTLLDYATENHLDMICMGSFGHSRLREMLLGSLTLKMLCTSSIPLLLLR